MDTIYTKEEKEIVLQINVIHDWKRKDRYELLLKEIADHNLDVKIWDAVHEFPKPRQNIAEAHKRLIRYAKENKMPEILVAEDDFHLTCNGAFEYYLSKKPHDYDLYLAGIIWGRIQSDNTTSDFAGFNMFMCHERYYDRFLESDGTRDIDRAQMRKGRFVVCNPLAVIQHETMSDNTKKIHRQAKLYLGKTLFNGSNG